MKNMYYYNPKLPKRVTTRAIILIELRASKPVYTNDRMLYHEIRERHPEFKELIHLVEPQHMCFSPEISGIAWNFKENK